MVVSWREVRWIWRMRQNFVTKFIQLLKHWLCDVQSGIVMEKNWAHSVDDYWLWVLQFWCISSTCRAYFSDVMVSPWFGKMQWIRWAADHQTVTMTFIGCKFGFEKCFGASSWSSHWAGRCWLSYKIYFSLHITIWLRNGSLLLCTVREDDTSKWWFFWLAVSSWGTYLSSFFIFLVCFKCWMTIAWLTLSSHVVVRGSVLMSLSIGCCQLLMTIHCAPHLQGSLLCKTSWTTTALYVH